MFRNVKCFFFFYYVSHIIFEIQNIINKKKFLSSFIFQSARDVESGLNITYMFLFYYYYFFINFTFLVLPFDENVKNIFSDQSDAVAVCRCMKNHIFSYFTTLWLKNFYVFTHISIRRGEYCYIYTNEIWLEINKSMRFFFSYFGIHGKNSFTASVILMKNISRFWYFQRFIFNINIIMST